METIKKQLSEILEVLKSDHLLNKPFYTLEEASRYLGQSKSSLYKLTSKKEIPFYVPGGKMIYFRQSELDEWILNSRVSTIDDIESSIDNYLSQPLNRKV